MGKEVKEQQKAKEGLCCLASMDFLDVTALHDVTAKCDGGHVGVPKA